MADAVGEKDDAMHARTMAGRIRDKILTFYDRNNHKFGNGVESSLALSYGVFAAEPEEERQLARSLGEHYRANGHTWDGGFMGYEIYPMLARHGYGDDALMVLRNTKGPSPTASIVKYDATTYYEAYHADKFEQMRQGLNFIVHSHPAAWLVTDLAGVRPDPLVPGGYRLIFAPAVPETEILDWVTGALTTSQGTARSAWRLAGANMQWDITVPPNTTAEIRVPAADAASVQGVAELKSLGFRDGHALFEAGPGNYCIGVRRSL
jgi:alpha-L-rhamnosidase